MKDNLELYNKGRAVPDEAKKTIGAGKLKGFTDINPMWRIKMLTEMFGPCGFGWYTEIKRFWTEEGKDGKIAAFCEMHLFVKQGEEWSRPIVGVGGSMLGNIWKGEPETSDECYKMAYTDAISVACKSLGIGADVYWEKDRTKYNANDAAESAFYCVKCGKKLDDVIRTKKRDYTAGEYYEKFGGLCGCCFTEAYNAKKKAENAGGE